MSNKGRGRGGGKSAENRTPSERESTEPDKCGSCKKPVNEEDNGLLCEICERWYHSSCQGMDELTYKVLNQECIHWFCKSCDKRVARLVTTVAKLEERQEILEKDMEDTKRELHSVKENITEIRVRVNDLENDRSEGTQGITREDVLEEMEKERRRNNLVVMGVKNEGEDQEFIKDMFTRLVGAKGVRAMDSVERIGKRDANKIRPIRVVLKNTETKFDILKAASELKNHPEYKDVYIMTDLTRKQQEAEKNLKKVFKEYKDQGEKDIRIKKGKVIKNVNGEEVTLFPPLH